MHDKICDTPVTKYMLENHLRNFYGLDENIYLDNIEAKKFEESQGYTSVLIRVKLTWKSRDGSQNMELPSTVIIKAIQEQTVRGLIEQMNIGISQDNQEQQNASFLESIRRAHNDECSAYEILEVNREDGLSGFPAVRCYGLERITFTSEGSAGGYLLLEDLRDTCNAINGFFKNLPMEHVLKIAKVLAHLHGWSLATTYPWRDTLPTLVQKRDVYEFFFHMADVKMASTKKTYPDQFGDIVVDQMAPFFEWAKFSEYMFPDEDVLQPVYVHGDFHLSNALFKLRQDTGEPDSGKLVALIDWQANHQGSGMEDVVRLTMMCMSTEDRRLHADHVLQVYYDEFRKHATGRADHVTFEQVKNMYEKCFAIHGIVGTVTVGFMLVAVQKAVPEAAWASAEKELLERFASCFQDARHTLGL